MENNTNTVQKLRSILGKLFECRFSYTTPTIVQVIGWTKTAEKPTSKVRYVYVKEIDLISNFHVYGGSSKINTNSIQNINSESKLQRSTHKLMVHLNGIDDTEGNEVSDIVLSKGSASSPAYELYVLIPDIDIHDIICGNSEYVISHCNY